jgi:uncharacterized protein with FMN-binding domain
VRRAVLAVLGATAGTTLLIGAKLGTRPAADLPAEVLSQPGAGSGPARPSAVVPAPGRTNRPPATAGAPASHPTSATGPAPHGTMRDGRFAGPAVSERYGTVQVTITVSGGRMVDVAAVYPTGGASGQINADAIPRLREEALAAQSARIATVSGATYTSTAYRESLQAALDRARA